MKRRCVTTHERLAAVAVVLVLWVAGVGARLVHLQVLNSAWYQERAIRQQEYTVEVSPTRGRILDREGRELARSIEVKSVYATIAEIGDPAAVASKLAPVIDAPEAEILERLCSDRSFVLLKRKVEPEVSARVVALELPGIELVDEFKRVYPKRELASHILGYCGVDGDGLAGLELAYDELVRGKAGRVVLTRDARGTTYEAAEIEPTPGNDLHLTIDQVAQYRAEQALAEGVRRTRARWGVAVVIRPKTGEIVALANYPTFDPNAFNKAPAEARPNRAIEVTFEPGSVFKIVPFSGCLEEGLVTPDTMVDCEYGSITVNGRTVKDGQYGVLSASDALAVSSNVAAIKMGMKLGNERLYDYIRRYGFGQKTGLGLPGESPGLVRPVEKWGPTTIGSIPMGHEIGVTAVQEVAAMAALANDGVYIQPHVVRQVVSPSGQVVSKTKPATRQVVSAGTARAMRGMLEDVVLNGTAKHAGLEDLRAAGKTGTAQKIDPRTGRYSHTKYLASFCGFAPAEDPEYACIVVLDEPTGGGYTGGVTAAPIFGQILSGIFAEQAVAVPRSSEIASAEQPARPVISGTELATVRGVEPAVDTRPSIVTVASEYNRDGGIVVPDLSARSLRAAIELGAASGLVVEAEGSGRVETQTPAPGAVVPPGAVVHVVLRR